MLPVGVNNAVLPQPQGFIVALSGRRSQRGTLVLVTFTRGGLGGGDAGFPLQHD